MAFLREDLQHLFDDQGIDVSRYDERVDFQDPITKYNSLQGTFIHCMVHVHTQAYNLMLSVHDCGGARVDFQDPVTKVQLVAGYVRVHMHVRTLDAYSTRVGWWWW